MARQIPTIPNTRSLPTTPVKTSVRSGQRNLSDAGKVTSISSERFARSLKDRDNQIRTINQG